LASIKTLKKDDEIGEEYSKQGKVQKCIENFWDKSLKNKELLESKGVDD
jgi:hypothetical protein